MSHDAGPPPAVLPPSPPERTVPPAAPAAGDEVAPAPTPRPDRELQRRERERRTWPEQMGCAGTLVASVLAAIATLLSLASLAWPALLPSSSLGASVSDVVIEQRPATYGDLQQLLGTPCATNDRGECAGREQRQSGFIASARVRVEGLANRRRIPVMGPLLDWLVGSPAAPSVEWTLVSADTGQPVPFASARRIAAFATMLPEAPVDWMRERFFVRCLPVPDPVILRVEIYRRGVRLDYAESEPFSAMCGGQ